jgi:hypothetical protein
MSRRLLWIGPKDICYDKSFEHGSGQLLGIKNHPSPNHIAVTSQSLDMNKLQTMFGHPISQVLADTVSNTVFIPKTLWNIPVPNVLFAKPSRKISTS